MAKRKKAAPRRRRRRSNPGPKRRSRKGGGKWGSRLKRLAAAGAIGFVRGQTTALTALEARLPAIAGTKTLALGGVLMVANDVLVKNRWLGYAAEAAMMVGAFEAGQGGFKVQGGASVLGDGTDDYAGDM